MNSKVSRWSLLTITAIVGSIAYCVFTYISLILYPGQFSPLDKYLSELGNFSLNPNGAIFYNVGVIQAGLLLFLFYLGLYISYRKPAGNELLAAIVVSGIFNALAVMMAGIFSEDIYTLHFIWGLLIFVTWIPVLALANAMLIKQTGFIRWISIYGLVLAIINTAFVGFVVLSFSSAGAIIEWIAIFGFLLWAVLVTIDTLLKYRESSGKNQIEQ